MALPQTKLNNFWNHQRTAVFAVFAYAGLTVLMTWPLTAQLGTHIPGQVGDSFMHLWTFHFVKDALLNGQSPYFTDQLFYPVGVTLVYHNIAWVNIAIWFILQTLVSDITAYTLMIMGVFVFNGFATFLFARELFQETKAAFLSGLVCAFWPYILAQQDTPNLIFIAWVPLALLSLRRMFANGRLRHALLSALFITLTGITRWQVLLMAAPLIGFYILYELGRGRAARSRHTVKLLALIGLLTILGLTPLLLPILYNQFTRTDPTELFLEEEVFSTDLLGFFLPSHYHPLWGKYLFDAAWQLSGNVLYTPFLGFTTLILAGIGVVKSWKSSRFWLFIALFYALWALGGTLYVNGRALMPLPYALAENSFIMQTIRFPERLNVILSIPMAILAGYGALALLRQPRLNTRRTWVIGGLCLLILAEYIVTYPTLEIATPDWYETISEEPGDFGILDIPMNMRKIFGKEYMVYQLVHQRPLVEGHVSRPPGEAYRFIESVPLLAQSRNQKMPPAAVPNVSAQLRQLAAANIRYLILHKEYLRETELQAWRDWLIIPPWHEDDELVVYRTDDVHIDDEMPIRYLLANVGEVQGQFGLIAATISPEQTRQGGWVNVAAQWGSETAVTQNYNACLTLTSESTPPLTVYCGPPSPTWPTANWQANELVHALYQFQVSPEWSPGIYQLNVTLEDVNGQPMGQPTAVGTLHIEGITRQFTPPDPQFATNVNWQNLITLVGYDLQTETGQLNLTLYWQALAAMDTTYKFFVHLLDPASGEIVAQADFVSQNWQYPTNWWAEGEYIPDPITIPIQELPAGRYQIRLGMYNPDTGARLHLVANGLELPDDAYLLHTIER